jgi:hypothetical protein
MSYNASKINAWEYIKNLSWKNGGKFVYSLIKSATQQEKPGQLNGRL